MGVNREIAALYDQVVCNPEDGVAANELLDVLRCNLKEGERYLRRALESADARVASTAAWIVSELGQRAECVQDVMVALLQHRTPSVRRWAAESVLLCSAESSVAALSAVMVLLNDEDDAVAVWVADRIAKLGVGFARTVHGMLQNNTHSPPQMSRLWAGYVDAIDCNGCETCKKMSSSEERAIALLGLAAASLRPDCRSVLQDALTSSHPAHAFCARVLLSNRPEE